MTDRYSKILLTIIAVTLVAGVVQRLADPAEAQPAACGSNLDTPCIVVIAKWNRTYNRAELCGNDPDQPCMTVLTK